MNGKELLIYEAKWRLKSRFQFEINHLIWWVVVVVVVVVVGKS